MTAIPQIFDRELVRKRRQRTSPHITQYDFLLKYVAEDLTDRLKIILREFPLALDFGAHHGVVGAKIRTLPSVGKVIFLDSSAKLISQCDGERVQANEEFLPFAPNSLDLVVSGLSLQYVNDLPGVLLQLRQALKPDGLFLAAIVGGRSLWELREAFALGQTEVEGGMSPHIAPFIDVRDAGHLLQRAGFSLPVTDSDLLTIQYTSALDLMRDLRGMGASNALVARSRNFLRRETFLRVMEIYQEKFALDNGKVAATFEILTLIGWCPHHSQQMPLRPGSAKSRLADALETKEVSAGEKARFKS